MDKINDGGPAAPTTKYWNEKYMDEAGYGRTRFVQGLVGGKTLRDHFAGVALPGILQLCFTDSLLPDETPEDMFARKSYAVADAMLRARNSGSQA